VSIHLAAGTDVDAENQWRATPLLKAPREGHKAISELLINNGADLNAKNVDGKTPLDYAIENNHTNIADLLRQHGGKTARLVKNWKLKRDILASREAGKTVDSMTQSSCI
jgi:ankyrin repeat protein